MNEQYNIPYILKHTRRAEAAFSKNQLDIAINSLWRIASNTEIFGEELNPTGNLTSEQVGKIKELILSLKLE